MYDTPPKKLNGKNKKRRLVLYEKIDKSKTDVLKRKKLILNLLYNIIIKTLKQTHVLSNDFSLGS